MADGETTANERVAIYVTIMGSQLKLHLPGDGWTFEEAKVAKAISEGMTPTAIEQGLFDGDPDAWLAVLRVSYLHADLTWPQAQIMGEDILDLMEELADQTREAIRARPPTKPTESESDAGSPGVENETTDSPS